MVDAFLPANLGTLTLSVTAAAIGARIPTGGVTGAFGSHSGGEYLEIQNVGPQIVFVETSPGASPGGVDTPSVTATVANSYPVLVGQRKIIRRAQGDSFISVIGAAAGPSTVYVTPGNGI